MTSKFMCVFCAAALAAAPLGALTLEEYLSLVLKTNPLVQSERISPDIEQQNIIRAEASKDIFLEAQGTSSHAEPVPSNPFVPEAIDIQTAGVSLSKLFWSTGGRLSLGWASTKTSQDLPQITIPSAGGSFTIPTGASLLYENNLTFLYSQPLLRNFGGSIEKNTYRASRSAYRSSDARSIENIEAFLGGEGESFIDWALYSEQAALAQERLMLARDQLENVQKMRRANLVDKTDVVRAQDALQSAEQGALFAESRLRAKKAEMAVTLQTDDFLQAEPEFDLYSTAELPVPAQACRELNERSRSLDDLRSQRESLQVQAMSAREAARPALDLNLRYGLIEGNEDFGDAFGLSRPAYMASLLFAYPLGARSASASARGAQLAVQKMDLGIEKASRDLCSALTGLLIRLEDMEKILELNRRQIELAGERTRAERSLYNQGRGQLTFVIQSMDSEVAAKSSCASNAANYQKMLLQYKVLMDRLYLTGE